MELYKKISLIGQENAELYKKVADKVKREYYWAPAKQHNWLSCNWFCSQIHEAEGPSEINRDSATPYNFAVVENRNVPVQLGLSTVHQQDDTEQSAAPKLG
jgi:MADS-box transcription factor